MKQRILYTALACAAFLAMLTGTSKKRPPREAGSIPKLAIPPTTGWASNEVAGIRFLSPPNAVVERADQLAGIRIELPSGASVGFEVSAVDVTTRPQSDYDMYLAPDAQITLVEQRSGDSCMALACTTVPIMGSLLCMNAYSTKHDECAQVVALVRSIQPL